MNLKRVTTLSAFAVILAIAGLSQAAQSDPDQSGSLLLRVPGIIMPGDNGSGALNVLPADDSKIRIEYRRILGGDEGGDSGLRFVPDDSDESYDSDKSGDAEEFTDSPGQSIVLAAGYGMESGGSSMSAGSTPGSSDNMSGKNGGGPDLDAGSTDRDDKDRSSFCDPGAGDKGATSGSKDSDDSEDGDY